MNTRVYNDFEGEYLGTNDTCVDAWGRQKVINDFSLFRGIWTFDVPNRVWEEASIDSAGDWTVIAATGTNATSVDGMLNLASGTTADEGAALSSKRHPRYEPNRGHLYSTAVMCPSPTADGIRRWGAYGEDNGVYFELEGDGSNWTLYACRKSDGTVKIRQALTMPTDFDPAKGHVYDIQYQWRGVGNYKWFVNLSTVYTDAILGTLTELSVQNPAAMASYESITHTTTEIVLNAGCVDISTEGGNGGNRVFQTVTTGTTLVQADATGRAVLGIKVPRTLSYGGGTVENTRDTVIGKVSGWVRD